jgi:hypothetical protein
LGPCLPDCDGGDRPLTPNALDFLARAPGETNLPSLRPRSDGGTAGFPRRGAEFFGQKHHDFVGRKDIK